MRLPFHALLVLSAALLFALSLHADTIGPSDCATCFGSVYTVTNLGRAGGTATTETWKFAFVIDTSGYTGQKSDYIGSIAVKVSSELLGSTLESAPGSDLNLWLTSENSGLSNAGCSGHGRGWLCFSGGDSSLTPVGSADPVYTWDFTVTIPTGTLLDAASIKANYDSRNGWITSESVPVPEHGGFELLFYIVATGICLYFKHSFGRRTLFGGNKDRLRL